MSFHKGDRAEYRKFDLHSATGKLIVELLYVLNNAWDVWYTPLGMENALQEAMNRVCISHPRFQDEEVRANFTLAIKNHFVDLGTIGRDDGSDWTKMFTVTYAAGDIRLELAKTTDVIGCLKNVFADYFLCAGFTFDELLISKGDKPYDPAKERWCDGKGK